jgi:disulfide bond formation protein DsbB
MRVATPEAMKAIRAILRWWPAWAAAASAALLAAAHAFERFGGYAPCALCLKQRELYWAALALGVAATLWTLVSRARATPRLASFLLFAVFGVQVIAAGFHAGVERKWWPGPTSCTGSADGVDAAAMSRLLEGASTAAPMCDAIAWQWAGLSMAGWNAAIALMLALVSAVAARRDKEIYRAP